MHSWEAFLKVSANTGGLNEQVTSLDQQIEEVEFAGTLFERRIQPERLAEFDLRTGAAESAPRQPFSDCAAFPTARFSADHSLKHSSLVLPLLCYDTLVLPLLDTKDFAS